MSAAKDVLKPGDVLAVRLPGWFGEVIRVGEELAGKPGLENHVAVFHHWDGDVPWMIEGRPGGVGWQDGRAYLASPYTLNNCLQPGRDGESRAVVAKHAEALLGDRYDWAAIGGDALAALHVRLWNLTFPHGLAPGEAVCSSLAAWLYEQAGWERPPVTDRDTTPADWTSMVLEHRWSATLELLPLVLGLKAGATVTINATDNLIWELQDQVQQGNRMLAALCRAHGVDPDKAGELPGEAEGPAAA